MSSLDLDLDAHMNNLETEWRQAYESSIVARADYQSLAASPKANASPARFRVRDIIGSSYLMVLRWTVSVRERPRPEVIADVAPEAV